MYGSEVTLRAYGAVEREVVCISCKEIQHLIRTKLLKQGAKELACQEGEESRREFTPAVVSTDVVPPWAFKTYFDLSCTRRTVSPSAPSDWRRLMISWRETVSNA